MKKANVFLRELIREKNIPYWKIALEIGIHESTLFRWMREELPKDKHEKIVRAIGMILMNEEK